MRQLIVLVLAGCLTPLAAAQGKDKLWEITSRMEMADMPPEMRGMKIPGFGGSQKQTVCLAEGKQYESEQQKDCTITDQKQSGKITRMTIRCKEGTMKLEREEISKDHWRMKMDMTTDGEKMSMFEEAKRIGSCDAAQEGNISRESQQVLDEVKVQRDANAAQIGKECQEAASRWPSSSHAFSTYDELAKSRRKGVSDARGNKDALRMVDSTFPDIPGCAKARADYCAKSKSAFGNVSSRKSYATILKQEKPAAVTQALSFCGHDLAPVTARHCKAALSDADYEFIGAYCPAERKVLAREHCAGRSYTAIEPKYRAICGGGDGSGDGGGEGGSVADKGAEAVEQGVKKLKGLFGF